MSDEKPKVGKRGEICVPCFAGVWIENTTAATCIHGTWSRSQADADKETPAPTDD